MSKTKLQNASLEYFTYVLSHWLDKIPKLVKSEKFLLLRSVEVRLLASLEVSYYPVYYHLPKLHAKYSTFFCYLSITDMNCISFSFYSCIALTSTPAELCGHLRLEQKGNA